MDQELGMTNILKNSLGLILIIIPYPYLLNSIELVSLESNLTLYIVAFICIDFASYWNHRLNHKINIFWNRHVIHHSSEEFNLACALRQSISAWIGFGALFLIPAAILGVSPKVISLLVPLHLFSQFWYHTQHIGKLGFLEYIIVTPSQHRVHHAINPIYIDKNLSAIFCVWDRIFGTFQEEIDEEPPVFGVLKPVKTWNPILINWQHAFNVIQDAYNSKSFIDKLRIWFMPTGWRPDDVVEEFPRTITVDIKNRKKYAPKYSSLLKVIALFHFISINFLLLFFLQNFSELTTSFKLIYGFIIFISIFGFTSLFDFYSWATNFEIFRSIFAILILTTFLSNQFLSSGFHISYILILSYFMFSIVIILFYKNRFKVHTH